MEWMLLPLKRYADFSGRSRRKEYWMFTLGVTIFYVLIAALFFATGNFSSSGSGPGGVAIGVLILAAIVVLAIFIPSLAVQVRRFHDQDKSGWFVLIGFIPYIGGLIVLVFMCLPGTKGANRFGPDPIETNLADVFR